MMRKAVFVLIAMATSLGAAAADNPYQVINGPKDFYFGHITLSDIRNDGRDPVILRSGAAKPEPAGMNCPIGPGDTIRTSAERRLEIQFDNATVVRLDGDSELHIETILAESLSSTAKVSNLLLRKGRLYIMYKQYNKDELFQVKTPATAIKLKHDTVARIGLAEGGDADVQVYNGKAFLMYEGKDGKQKDLTVLKNERAVIGADKRYALQGLEPDSDFERWNKAVNEDFEKLHKGQFQLPKPIQKLPRAVFYFAQTYGNKYGEWLWDAYFGYVWRPFYNDVYPWGSWSPYFAGRWSLYNGQMFWVPTEPWGWVPYHLGVWQWFKKTGWVWIPGSAFAPAWVDWAFFGGYYCWSPWMAWDWIWYRYGSNPMYMRGSAFYNWYYDQFYDQYYYANSPGNMPWLYSPTPSNPVRTTPELKTVSRDQLKDPKAPFPIPKDLQKGLDKLIAAFKRGDPDAVASLQAKMDSAVAVDRNSLTAAHIPDQSVRVKDLVAYTKTLPATDPVRAVLSMLPKSSEVSTFYAGYDFLGRSQGYANIPSGPGRTVPGDPFPATGSGRIKDAGGKAATRWMDWNPDIRAARELGVDIAYVSRSNQIICPQLGIASGSGHFRGRDNSGIGSVLGSSGNPAAGSSGASSSSSSSSSSSTSSNTSSSQGSSGGHIK